LAGLVIYSVIVASCGDCGGAVVLIYTNSRKSVTIEQLLRILMQNAK